MWAGTRAGFRATLAARFGATEVLPSRPDALVARTAELIITKPLTPWSGETVETSLRLLDAGGTLVISGVEKSHRFEWTPLYFKELRVVGSNGFGVETVRGVAKHAMAHYFDFLAAGFDLTAVITHRFALDRWADVVAAVRDARRSGAVKVLLTPPYNP